ncbi:MAG: glycoside hydrolase, partial [Verrucomicrobia bacterium]|nr:glycoside hydrolase [Verrucomicrobiota bacterium]
QLDHAQATRFNGLVAGTEDWWHDFWSGGFVALHGAGGGADFVGRNYTYFLYLMGASSRGDYPPRFGGMLWNVTGGMQEWGSQFWWNNMDCYYGGLMPANRPALCDPLFKMYFGMFDACARAAREVWHSKGIYIPETGFFNGPENLPPAIAVEMGQLYSLQKPWADRSPAFMRYAATKNPHNSLWNWIGNGSWVDGTWTIKGRRAGPHGPVVGLFHSGAKIAFLFWEHYEFTQDKTWLRDRAYPMLKGIAEFYRNYPGTKMGADGKWHIHNVNNSEGIWGGTDSQEDISAMRGIFPAAIRASRILNVDPGLRAKWESFLANLAPLPTNAKGQWVVARPPTVHGNPNMPGLTPAIYYGLCTVSTTNSAMLQSANATYDVIRNDQRWWRSASANASTTNSSASGFNPQTAVSVLSPIATIAAHLGRGADLRYILPNQIRCLRPQGDFCDWGGSGKAGVLANRMTLREGPGDICAERLGRVARGVNDGLLQSAPPMPGGDPLITVFPAWPAQWDAAFTLLARGAFVVSSARVNGTIPFIQIRSQAGCPCRLTNPWPGAHVTLFRNGKPSDTLSGAILAFPTQKGETIALAPEGRKPSPITIPES